MKKPLPRFVRSTGIVISASVLGIASAFLGALIGILSGNISFFAIPVFTSVYTLLLNRGIPKAEH